MTLLEPVSVGSWLEESAAGASMGWDCYNVLLQTPGNTMKNDGEFQRWTPLVDLPVMAQSQPYLIRISARLRNVCSSNFDVIVHSPDYYV